MKIKKIIGIALAVLLLAGALAFAACGESGGGDAGKIDTYVMEAEYVEIADVKGSGLSSDQTGYNMIYGDGTDAQKDKGWSGGYYVGYTYTADFSMDFVFEADAAASATIILRLGSELGSISLTPDNFAVKLNGEAIVYNSMYIENSESMSEMKFSDKTVSTSAQLAAGTNTLNLSVLPNKLKNGSGTGGPTIDCVKIETSAKLTYTENKENPGKRGEI